VAGLGDRAAVNNSDYMLWAHTRCIGEAEVEELVGDCLSRVVPDVGSNDSWCGEAKQHKCTREVREVVTQPLYYMACRDQCCASC
jgi:hypothetical protein